MSQYYVLVADTHVEELASVMDIPEEIDYDDWFKGKVLTIDNAKSIPAKLKRGSGKFRGSIMPGVLPLFFEDFIKQLKDFGVENIQHQYVDLYDPAAGETLYKYYLVNIVGLISCVNDFDMSLPAWERPKLEKFTIDATKTNGLHIFRLAEKPRLIVISQELRKAILANGPVGIQMIPTTEFTGFMG